MRCAIYGKLGMVQMMVSYCVAYSLHKEEQNLRYDQRKMLFGTRNKNMTYEPWLSSDVPLRLGLVPSQQQTGIYKPQTAV